MPIAPYPVAPVITPVITQGYAARLNELFAHKIPYWQVELILALITIVLIILLILSRMRFFTMWKQSGLSIFSLHPYLGRRWSEIAARKEKKKSKEGKDFTLETMSEKEKREAFREFIQELPLYCITDNFLSSIIRALMSRGGARYQQVVLHDPGNTEDVYLYVRRVGDYFIHQGGIYLWPWKNSKRVLHWDLTDCRPLVDFHEGAQWENPRMNARYFWGVVNKISVSSKGESAVSSNLIVIGLIVIVIAVAITAFIQHQQIATLQDTLANMNFTRAPGIYTGVQT